MLLWRVVAVTFPLFVIMRLSRFGSEFLLVTAYSDRGAFGLFRCDHSAAHERRCDGFTQILRFTPFCIVAHMSRSASDVL